MNEQNTIQEDPRLDKFWDGLKLTFPDGMRHFNKWVDCYKARMGWSELFLNNIKFHDLPLAMQTGIFFEYCADRGGCHYEIDLLDYDIREEISGMIMMIQEEEQS